MVEWMLEAVPPPSRLKRLPVMCAEAEVSKCQSTRKSSQGSTISVADTAKALTVTATGGVVSVKNVPGFIAGLKVAVLIRSGHLLTGGKSMEHSVVFRTLRGGINVLVQALKKGIFQILSLLQIRGFKAGSLLVMLVAVCRRLSLLRSMRIRTSKLGFKHGKRPIRFSVT